MTVVKQHLYDRIGCVHMRRFEVLQIGSLSHHSLRVIGKSAPGQKGDLQWMKAQHRLNVSVIGIHFLEILMDTLLRPFFCYRLFWFNV